MSKEPVPPELLRQVAGCPGVPAPQNVDILATLPAAAWQTMHPTSPLPLLQAAFADRPVHRRSRRRGRATLLRRIADFVRGRSCGNDRFQRLSRLGEYDLRRLWLGTAHEPRPDGSPALFTAVDGLDRGGFRRADVHAGRPGSDRNPCRRSYDRQPDLRGTRRPAYPPARGPAQMLGSYRRDGRWRNTKASGAARVGEDRPDSLNPPSPHWRSAVRFTRCMADDGSGQATIYVDGEVLRVFAQPVEVRLAGFRRRTHPVFGNVRCHRRRFCSGMDTVQATHRGGSMAGARYGRVSKSVRYHDCFTRTERRAGRRHKPTRCGGRRDRPRRRDWHGDGGPNLH